VGYPVELDKSDDKVITSTNIAAAQAHVKIVLRGTNATSMATPKSAFTNRLAF
jgi:hypothetical protein